MTSQNTGGHLDLAGIIKWRIMYIMLNMVSRQVSQSFSFALHASYQAHNAFHHGDTM